MEESKDNALDDQPILRPTQEKMDRLCNMSFGHRNGGDNQIRHCQGIGKGRTEEILSGS